MYISKAKKYHQLEDGTIVAYDYYRLTKKYRESKGNPRSCSVLCLGALGRYPLRPRLMRKRLSS